FHVTGVQTCALPICADAMLPQGSLHQDQTPERGLRIQPSPWPNGQSTVLVTSVDQEPALIEQDLLGFWLKQRLGQLDEDQRRVQIGRASCRERVAMR